MEDLRHDERLEASVHEDCVEADDGEWDGLIRIGGMDMDVSENSGFPPKSSILIGFSMINHIFWGTHIFGNIHIGCFLKWWENHHFTLQVLIIFSRKNPMGLLEKPQHFRSCPHMNDYRDPP